MDKYNSLTNLLCLNKIKLKFLILFWTCLGGGIIQKSENCEKLDTIIIDFYIVK